MIMTRTKPATPRETINVVPLSCCWSLVVASAGSKLEIQGHSSKAQAQRLEGSVPIALGQLRLQGICCSKAMQPESSPQPASWKHLTIHRVVKQRQRSCLVTFLLHMCSQAGIENMHPTVRSVEYRPLLDLTLKPNDAASSCHPCLHYLCLLIRFG